METKFSAYNTHRYAPDQLWQADNHLSQLGQQPYIYQNPVLEELPKNVPGIYTIGGGRQIGKTTLLKQWIAALIADGIAAKAIIFFTGELIDDHHALVTLIQSFVTDHATYPHLYLIIDEITYINHWDKGIKFLADAGYFRRCSVILTGSDLTLMQSARMTFPGRRGNANKVDFHIYPLSFKEFLTLKDIVPDIDSYLHNDETPPINIMETIHQEFNGYLQHGGYLTAINDIARYGEITLSTLQIYSDWIRGDILKKGKQENYLREIILAIIKRYNKQVTWHAIADALSIDSHKTVADYCELLATMDALFIQHALLTDKLVAAPKKARKITFTDPFIFHALNYWLQPMTDSPQQQIIQHITDPHISADLVEAIVSNHYRRYFPTYYIKAEGEIDIAYIDKNTYWPIEIKWRNHLRAKDLKQINKYPNARVFCKSLEYYNVDNLLIEPLVLALLKIPSS